MPGPRRFARCELTDLGADDLGTVDLGEPGVGA